MRVWRINQDRYDPLSGEGARLHGARWNSRGIPVAYTAGSLSLAIVELLVHTDPDLVPANLAAFEIDIPDGVSLRRIAPEDLPDGWASHEVFSACREMGDEWARDGRDCVLQVPSAVVPEESNFLINPRHADAERVTVVSSRPFSFDPRLLR